MKFTEYLFEEVGFELPEFVVNQYNKWQEDGELETLINKGSNPTVTFHYLNYLKYCVENSVELKYQY